LHILLTGAGGYIGARLLEVLQSQGAIVTVLGRAPSGLLNRTEVSVVPWRLGEAVPDQAFAAKGEAPPVDVVIHLAHDWADDSTPNLNIEGTRRLLAAARAHGVRVVYASSVSAREGALNRYGRIKYEIEAMLEPPRELAARIGMVYGGPLRGQWGTLCRISGLAPVLPMLEHRKPVQPIHLDDLCEGLLRLATLEEPARAIYGLADPGPLPFGDTLAAIARHRHGRRLRLVNIPLGFALGVVGLASKIPGLPRIDRERLLGLAGLPVIDTADSLAELGLVLRRFEDGLRPEPWRIRRALLGEGAVLLRYVLGHRPPPSAARRYLRGVSAEAGGQAPLALPAAVRTWPPLLRLIEPVGGNSPLARRLYLATLVAEATPGGGAVFYDHAGRGRLGLLVSLAATGLIEVLCLPMRLLPGLWRR
jgi:nucleoside-diphosphate-sugar epimerase